MDFDAIKKHPYAIGGAVIVGGVILFVLLSSSQSSGSTTAASSSSNEGQLLSADLQMQSIQAGVALQAQQNQVQLSTAQLSADTTNQQTAAALAATKDSDITGLAASLYGTQAQVQVANIQAQSDTTQQANQLMYAQNMQGMQDQVLTDQINQSTVQDANNNAAMIAGDQITANYQIGVAQLQNDSNTMNDVTGLAETNIAAGVSNYNTAAQTQIANTVVNDSYNIAQSKQNAVNSELGYITQHAGDQKNSALDATDQTSVFQTILSGFSPSVASTGTAASASTASSGNAASTAKFGAVASTISNLGNSIAGGLFG